MFIIFDGTIQSLMHTAAMRLRLVLYAGQKKSAMRNNKYNDKLKVIA